MILPTIFAINLIAFATAATLGSLAFCRRSVTTTVVGSIGTLLVGALTLYMTNDISSIKSGWTGEPVTPTWHIVLVIGTGSVLITGLTTWILARRRPRSLTIANNFCITCGYDLRGTPSGECPECGEQNLRD